MLAGDSTLHAWKDIINYTSLLSLSGQATDLTNCLVSIRDQ